MPLDVAAVLGARDDQGNDLFVASTALDCAHPGCRPGGVDAAAEEELVVAVDDGVERFVDHRCTPEGRAFEVIAESVRFPLADVTALPEPAMAAAA